MTNVDTQKTTGVLQGYLTPEEMAQQIGVSPRTLSRWQVHRIGPPRVKVGRQVFHRLASVLEWLESREQRRKK